MKEICAHVGVSRPTLYSYMEQGLPSHQPAGEKGRRLFDSAAVDAWIRNRWSAPAPECTCTITQWERMEDHACPVHFPEEDLTPAYGIERPVA